MNQIDDILEKAEQAFLESDGVQHLDFAVLLKEIIKELQHKRKHIIETYISESNYPRPRAEGEFGRTIGQIEEFCALLLRGDHLRIKIDHSTESNPDLRSILVPIGPVVVFGASNFPLAFSTAGGDTISALAAGCPVIIKAHPYHTKTSEVVASCLSKAVEKAGLHEGFVSHVVGADHRIGQSLVAHPIVKAVGFTGSFAGGKALYDLAQKRDIPIPVFAEMGSVNPVIILRDKLNSTTSLSKQLGDSVLLGTGQFCTNPGLIFINTENPGHSFVQNLKDQILTADLGPMVAPQIEQSYKLKLDQLKDTVPDLNLSRSSDSLGAVGVTTISHFSKNPDLLHEIFGPYCLIVLFDEVKELLEVLKELPGQLTLTILGSINESIEVDKIAKSLRQKVGRILYGGVPTGVAVRPTMTHGGPFPATTDQRFTSVGTEAIYRWLRPITYQDCPDNLLPLALKDKNPLELIRKVNGKEI